MPFRSIKANEFLDVYKHKIQSYKKHKTAITLLFEMIDNEETYIIDIDEIQDYQTERKMKRKYEKDLIKFQIFLEEKEYSSNSINAYISSIRQLLEHHSIELDKTTWKKLKRLRSRNGTELHDMTPTKKQVQEILSNANSFERAIFLTLISTGKRTDEISNIDLNDLHLDETPPRINITRPSSTTKRRTPYSFITNECKEAILVWIKQRELFIKEMNQRTNLPNNKKIDENTTKLFPISESRIAHRWIKLLKKTNLDEISETKKTKQYIFHLHTIRKYFRTYLGNRDLAEYFLGHYSIHNLYFKKPHELIADDYLKYSANLNIYATTDIEEKLEREIKQLKKNHNDLIKWLQYLMNDRPDAKAPNEITEDNFKLFTKYKILKDINSNDKKYKDVKKGDKLLVK